MSYLAGTRELYGQDVQEQVEGAGYKAQGKGAGREHLLEPADLVGDQVSILNQRGCRGDVVLARLE